MRIGDRVKSVSEGPLGVLSSEQAGKFREDVFVEEGRLGTIVVPEDGMPDGWLMVDFDERGISPVHPRMIELVSSEGGSK